MIGNGDRKSTSRRVRSGLGNPCSTSWRITPSRHTSPLSTAACSACTSRAPAGCPAAARGTRPPYPPARSPTAALLLVVEPRIPLELAEELEDAALLAA